MAKTARIMVVDHSKLSRTTLARALRTELGNVSLCSCGSAQEALEHLESGESFDLITTSLMLEDMDGLDLIERVQASERGKSIPIVVVSGGANERLAEGVLSAGVTNYFDKSGGYGALIDFIKDLAQRNFVEGRVLYVEDDMLTAKHTQKVLERNGLHVLHTTSGEQALAVLKQTGGCGTGQDKGGTFFDLVVTDFYLKGAMNAANLLHAIRVQMRYSQQEMPVLVITAGDAEKNQIEAFRAGANDFVTKPFIEEVLVTRIRSLLLIKQQFNALKRQAEEMHRLAITDSLTEVYNRQYLIDIGQEMLDQNSNQPVSLLILDIDHFKAINDNHGHLTGDQVLKSMGRTLRNKLPEDAVSVRFGGEEFCTLLPHCSRIKAMAVAEELRQDIATVRPQDLDVKVSIGVVSNQDFPDVGLNALLGFADKALYAAKKRGRNRVCLYGKKGVERS
jgi:two-component system cell cycle response regulator